MLPRMNTWGMASLLCLAMLTWAATGCNRGPEMPPLASVTGTVTLDGKPVTSGIVTFVPDVEKGTEGSLGMGVMDANGHYTISTLEAEGAMVGFHRIRIENPFGPNYAVPTRYANAATSGLTTEVKAGEDNVVNLKLTTSP